MDAKREHFLYSRSAFTCLWGYCKLFFFGSIASFLILIDVTGEHFTRTYYGTAGICSAFVAAVFTTWMFNRISQWKSGYRKEDFEINDVYLVQLVQDNIDAVKLGKEPVEIINKVFLDSISDIGGAGATLALVIAILLVSKNRSTKKWQVTVLYHQLPVLNLLIGYVATVIGVMPVVIQQLDWITPPILSGYLMTKSINGAIMQLVLIVIDVLIYIPFVKRMDRKGNVIEELYEDDIEKIKTMEEKQQENRRLIHSLTNIFGDVYEADVLQKTVHLVHSKFKNSYFSY